MRPRILSTVPFWFATTQIQNVSQSPVTFSHQPTNKQITSNTQNITAIMLPLLLLLPAALGTSALALPKRADAPTSTSTGFRLLVQVIKPFPDISPPIDKKYLTTAHTGAGLSAADVSGNATNGRIWYQNGTAPASAQELSGILTDGGYLPAPYGIGLQGPDEFDGTVYPKEHRVSVNVGPGTPTMGVELNDEKLPVLRVRDVAGLGGKWIVCRRKIWYYYPEDWEFSVLRYVYAGEETPTDECAPVDLVPVCAELPELPEGSYSSHEFAVEVPCVVDAAALA